MPKDKSQEASERSIQEIVKSFNENLREANNRSSKLYHHFVQQIQIAYWLTLLLFVFVGLTSGLIIAISAYFAFRSDSSKFMHIFSVLGLMIGSISLALILIYHPLRSVRRSLLEMMKIGVIYLGYTRQIYQIDAEFKKNLSEHQSVTELRNLVKQTQAVIEQVVENLTISLDGTFE